MWGPSITLNNPGCSHGTYLRLPREKPGPGSGPTGEQDQEVRKEGQTEGLRPRAAAAAALRMEP